MTKLIALLLITYGVFSPQISSWIFIAFIIILESIIFIVNSDGKNLNSSKLDDNQNAILTKYSFLVRYPMTSRGLSSTLSLIQLSAIFWIPFLLWKSEYIQAIIIAINYIPAGLLAAKLNPQFFLDQQSKKQKGIESIQSEIERDSITEVLEIVWSIPKDETPQQKR